MKTHAHQRGFTLIEIGVVLAIIGVLAAIGIPSVSFMLRRGRVQSIVASLPTWKGYVAALASSNGGNGTIPVTEGNVSPCTGTAFKAQAAAGNAANAARLDLAFVSLGITDKLITFGMGNPSQVPDNSTNPDMQWSSRYHAFYMDDGTSTGTPSTTATAQRDWSACSRLEARVSTPSITTPSTAYGANFLLDGTNSVTANTIIAYAVLKDVPYKDAYELSRAVNGDDLTSTAGSSQEKGTVVFAAPAGPTVDVYIYITQI